MYVASWGCPISESVVLVMAPSFVWRKVVQFMEDKTCLRMVEIQMGAFVIGGVVVLMFLPKVEVPINY
jgi:hypothetical protein